MGIKPGPKRIAKTTGKPDKRQRDNKETPGNTPSLKPHKHKKGDQIMEFRNVNTSNLTFKYPVTWEKEKADTYNQLR